MKIKPYMSWIIVVIAMFFVVIVLLNRYNISLGDGNDISELKAYSKHYVLITEEIDTPFWQSVYESAKKEAEVNHIYLEQIGNNLSEEYNLEDYLRISNASKVDGIIVYQDGSEGVAELINEASGAGIPVVTILNDTLNTKRVSFVGINSYQLGLVYADQILKQMNTDTRNIYVLFHHSESNSLNDVVFSQITKTLNKELGEKSVNIQPYYITNNNEFDTEEAVRDIFIASDIVPDILVCLEEVDTERAIQAIVDYNMVGKVKIIGTYSSDIVLEAIKKHLAAVTVSIDTEQLGKQSVQALLEYQQMGYVNSYYNVDLHIINEENVDSYSKE